MVRWLRWHCPPDTGFESRALAVWGRARYLSVTEAPHNTNFHTWMGKKHFCFFQTAETGNRTPNSGVKGSGANHYPRAPAHIVETRVTVLSGVKETNGDSLASIDFMLTSTGNGGGRNTCEDIFYLVYLGLYLIISWIFRILARGEDQYNYVYKILSRIFVYSTQTD